MARYRIRRRQQMIMVPVNLDDQLQLGTFEHAIDYILDRHIDLTGFDCRYHNDEIGRPAWDPAVMLKIILFAYSRGIVSSRQIARACQENVVFMALSDDSRPHYTTIADFISSMGEQAQNVFRDVLLICSELDLIGGEFVAVDGCKLSSNAAKEWSGTREHLQRKQEKIAQVIATMRKRHAGQDKSDSKQDAGQDAADDRLPERIKKLEKKVERIGRFLEKHGVRIGNRRSEVQSNITDPESAKMISSHGMVQGYNGLAMVDDKAQVILHAAAFGCGQEYRLLDPMLAGTTANLAAVGWGDDPLRGIKLAADTNYHSLDNCNRLAEAGIEGFVPDVLFRKRDPRFAAIADRYRTNRRRLFKLEDFHYDAANDKYVCPAGKDLPLRFSKKQAKSYSVRQYGARKSDCLPCERKESCLQRNARRRWLSINLGRDNSDHMNRMKERIDTPYGRLMYSRRMGIVEPVFGNITAAKRLNRITLRGQMKATIQWMLYAVVHNIGKIMRADYSGLMPT